jgi:hypothetical protein
MQTVATSLPGSYKILLSAEHENQNLYTDDLTGHKWLFFRKVACSGHAVASTCFRQTVHDRMDRKEHETMTALSGDYSKQREGRIGGSVYTYFINISTRTQHWIRFVSILSSHLSISLPGGLRKVIPLTYCMQTTVFWNKTPLVNRRFGGIYRPYLQDRRISKTSSTCHLCLRWYLTRLILRSWRWRQYVPPKRRMTFTVLYPGRYYSP